MKLLIEDGIAIAVNQIVAIKIINASTFGHASEAWMVDIVTGFVSFNITFATEAEARAKFNEIKSVLEECE